MIQIWQVSSECGPSNLVVLAATFAVKHLTTQIIQLDMFMQLMKGKSPFSVMYVVVRFTENLNWSNTFKGFMKALNPTNVIL